MRIRTYNLMTINLETIVIHAEGFETIQKRVEGIDDIRIVFRNGGNEVCSIHKNLVKAIFELPLLSEPVCVYEDGQGASSGSLYRSETP